MESDYGALAKYFGGPITGPTNTDVAKFILLNANNSKPLGPGAVKTNGPSVMGRIFDVLSRPNYAIANATKAVQEGNPDIAGEFWQGIKGEDKTTFSDVLKNAGFDDLKAGALGFGLDVLTDPLTYVTGAPIIKGVKALTGGAKAAEKTAAALGDKTLAQKILSSGEAVHPESFGLEAKATGEIPAAFKKEIPAPDSVTTVPLPVEGKIAQAGDQLLMDLPGVPKTTINPKATGSLPVGKAKQLPGQLPLNLKGLKPIVPAEKAVETIAKIEQGNPEALAKLIPMPPPPLDRAANTLADKILTNFDPGKAKATLNLKHPESLNAKQQLKLWYKAKEVALKTVYSKGRNPAKVATAVEQAALKGYHAAEARLVDLGYIPRIGTGENVKFSDVLKDFTLRGIPLTDDVLKDFGSTIRPGTELYKTVEGLRARSAVGDTSSISDILARTSQAKTETVGTQLLSDGQLKDFDKFLKKFGAASAKAKGVSPAGQRSTEQLINMAMDSSKSAAQVAVEHNTRMLDDIISTGRQNPKAAGIVTRALEKDLGKLPAWANDGNKATEFMMGRFATWWGQRDLRPFSLNAIGASSATAAARGKALRDLMAPFSTAQRHEAVRLAQGYGVASSPEVEQFATQVKRMMDNLVGNTTGQSVITRSAVDRTILNKWMKRYNVGFKFLDGKVKDLTGKTVDYSKGTDWVNSWKTATVKEDPEVFLFKLQQAMEQATREKALYEELGQRFGQTVPGGSFKTKIAGHPYLEGYHFTDDIAKQIPRVAKDWSIPSWEPGSPLVSLYDRVMSMWKSGVTIYRPAHHVRNMAGDMYLGWMDGVNTARPYLLATRVQRAMKDAYPDLQDVDKLVEVGLLSRNYATPKPGEILFRNKSGVPFTAEQIGAVAHQKGLLEHTRTIEDIIDLGDSGRKSILDVKPFGGKVQKFARGASELIGHNARLAHFIDKVAKSRGKDLADIFEQASRRARKWHPTGLDLTPFEKKYMRRIIPFYSWIRKSTPLLLEGMVMNPGKVIIPSKMYEGIQTAQGIETPGRDDPFPVDQMFPQWIRAQGLGPISLPDGVLGSFSNQSPPGYVMAGVGLNPLSDLMSQAESPAKTILSSLSPAAQIPMELLTGRKNFTGEPISGPDARPGAMGQYIGEQIPMWSALQGITGVTPFGGETRKSEKSGGDATREAFINWMTAAGIKGTGPYRKQAFFEKRAPVIAENKALKADFLKGLGG